jgi:RNA polymerase sigma factor (sigma-70 family)
MSFRARGQRDMGATEDRLFERWCRQGDAEALGELFDLASPGLLRLAIHLVGEPAEAEDLVQTTFLAAIEQRASVDSSRPVLPWLTAVLSNKAADHKRRASRSLDVERLLKSPEDEAPHPAEQRELSGELAKAIDALEEPYRQVMILRLRHGLSPADIAHVLERSPGAVRVQLHRAQLKLRGRLPSSLVGAFLIGAAAPRGLAAMRAEIVAKAFSIAPATSAAATTATILGVSIMSKKIVLAVVAGLLASGIWWLTAHEASPQASSPAPETNVALALAGVESPTSPSTSEAERQRVAIRSDPLAAEPSRFGSLEIDVVWSDGTPAPGVGLEQLGSVSTNGRSTFWTTDAAGRVHIDRIFAGARGFLLDRWSRFDPAFRQIDADVQAGQLNHLRIEVPRGCDVRGVSSTRKAMRSRPPNFGDRAWRLRTSSQRQRRMAPS